jgi:hypothetical protein
MKARWMVVPLVVALAGMVPAAALGQGQGPPSVEKIELGAHVSGDRLVPSDLPGHVVVVFFWDMG